MMLEQLKEQHLQEMEELRNQLESKVSVVNTIDFTFNKHLNSIIKWAKDRHINAILLLAIPLLTT